jgi:uncharacterized membrane protein
MSKVKQVSMYLMGILYVLAGLNHFIAPEFYLKIMPPYMGWHKELVFVSGLIEIGLGALLFLPQYRKIAAWGIILLLVAVFPANIYLAQTDGAALGVSALAAWVRLPIQLLLILWAWWYTRADGASKSQSKSVPKAKKRK